MKIIGITGGTGAGKTTALEAVKQLGGIVIDCDQVYHQLLAGSDDMLQQLRENFPGAFENGKFDRKALGRIVFSDENALQKLNGITHKFVGMEVDKILADFARAGGELAAIDAIALIESGLGKKCDACVCITAPKEVRAKRIMERENIAYEYALMRIQAQKSDEFFRENCDYVLNNDGSLSKEEFEAQCRKVFEKIEKK
jgi:dephospho-CoA kinase